MEGRTNPMINPELVLAYGFPETTYRYTERDAAMYALGVGACGKNAVDANELKYVYHNDGQQFIKVLPTFAALFTISSIPALSDIPGMEFDPQLLLHGQQYIEIYKPLPSNGCIRNKARVAGLHDKGKAAILEIETTSFDIESGEPLCMNRTTVYLRGAGGISKSSHPYSYSKYSGNQLPAIKIPDSQPFATFEDITRPSQALLYRLAGDYNPLHSDPMVAQTAGWIFQEIGGKGKFSTWWVGNRIVRWLPLELTPADPNRAIISCICRGDSDLVKSLSGRFLLHVFPGETLITEMWLQGLRVIYQVKVKDRNKVVLAGHVEFNRLSSQL